MCCGFVLAACAHDSGASPLPLEASNLELSGGYKTIYSFGQHGKFDDGQEPIADLILSGSELYGTTQSGGTTNAYCYAGCGTVFAVSGSGTERVIYRFKGGSDGAQPAGGLIAVNGSLYGTTSAGGANSACSGGCGTVFSMTTDGKSEHVLYRFEGGTDGADPVASLVSSNGSFYGSTQYGGTSTRLCSEGCGTVFKVSASGAESVIYRFNGGKDGAQPVARLIALDGTLYGTTEYGGTNTAFCATGCGTLFALSTAGAKKIIHSFKYTPGSNDGAYPAAGPTAMGRELYGTTFGGGDASNGTVFKANPASGAESVVHSFSCCASNDDGAYPLARLIRANGALYGTTHDGGTHDKGTLFKITTAGVESVLHSFTGKPDGAEPQASLLLMGGALYGTTAAGGLTSEGTVFELTP